MVQTYEQYVLCYHAVAALFEQQLKMIDAHTYENLDEDGQPILFRSLSDEARNSSSADSSEEFNESSAAAKSTSPATSVEAQPTVKDAEAEPFEEEVSSTFNASLVIGRISPSPDHKQERLVGKATVIRRPSIAKLKAMFENIQTVEQQAQAEAPAPARPTLQRSHSTRERSSSFGLSTARASKLDDMAQALRQQHAAVVNEVQALCASFGAEHAAVAASQRSSQSTDSDNINRVPPPEDIQQQSMQSEYNEPLYGYGYATGGAIARDVLVSNEPDRYVHHAPPKPPRTYHPQYVPYLETRGNSRDDSIGRIIYTVASPKQTFAAIDDSRIRPAQRTYQRHTSTPNLAAAFNMPLSLAAEHHEQKLRYAEMASARPLHAQTSQVVSQPELIYQPLMRSQHPIPTGEEIYQPLPVPKNAIITHYNVPPYIQAEHRKAMGEQLLGMPRRDIGYSQRPLSTYEGVYEAKVPTSNPLADQAFMNYISSTQNVKSLPPQQPKAQPPATVMINQGNRSRDGSALPHIQPAPAASLTHANASSGKDNAKDAKADAKKNSFTLPSLFGKSKSKKKHEKLPPTSKSVPSNLMKANTGKVWHFKCDTYVYCFACSASGSNESSTSLAPLFTAYAVDASLRDVH